MAAQVMLSLGRRGSMAIASSGVPSGSAAWQWSLKVGGSTTFVLNWFEELKRLVPTN